MSRYWTHYRSRAFDPETGRFLQEDPIWFEAGDLNVCRYVWNAPANWADASGMSATAEYGGLGATAIGLHAGLTINRVIRVAAWVRQWNGTRYIAREVVKSDSGKPGTVQFSITVPGYLKTSPFVSMDRQR